jgi:hypothetical protein
MEKLKSFALGMLIVVIVGPIGAFVPGGLVTRHLGFVFISGGVAIGAFSEFMRSRAMPNPAKGALKEPGRLFLAYALAGVVAQVHRRQDSISSTSEPLGS